MVRDAIRSVSERLHEFHERAAIVRVHRSEGVARALRFAPVPEDGFADVARAAIVQKERVSVDRLHQADAPQGRDLIAKYVGQFLGDACHVLQLFFISDISQKLGLLLDRFACEIIDATLQQHHEGILRFSRYRHSSEIGFSQ